MVVLLADIRKKLFRLWFGGTLIIVTLVLIQTISNKFELIEGTAWLWVSVHLLPSLLLLFSAIILNKNPTKVLLKTTFYAIYASVLAYLLLLWTTLVSMPFATRHQSIENYLQTSYWWLLPFQLVLIALLALLYFRKEPFFQPNAAIIQAFADKKRAFATQQNNMLQTQTFDLLIEDTDLNKILLILRDNLIDDKQKIILLQSQYAHWQRNRDLNITSDDILQRELNRLTWATIQYIEKL